MRSDAVHVYEVGVDFAPGSERGFQVMLVNIILDLCIILIISHFIWEKKTLLFGIYLSDHSQTRSGFLCVWEGWQYNRMRENDSYELMSDAVLTSVKWLPTAS